MREPETITVSTLCASAGAVAAIAKIEDAASSEVLVIGVSPYMDRLHARPFYGDDVRRYIYLIVRCALSMREFAKPRHLHIFDAENRMKLSAREMSERTVGRSSVCGVTPRLADAPRGSR